MRFVDMKRNYEAWELIERVKSLKSGFFSLFLCFSELPPCLYKIRKLQVLCNSARSFVIDQTFKNIEITAEIC